MKDEGSASRALMVQRSFFILHPSSFLVHFALTMFANSLYAPGTPAGSCRNHE